MDLDLLIFRLSLAVSHWRVMPLEIHSGIVKPLKNYSIDDMLLLHFEQIQSGLGEMTQSLAFKLLNF